MNIRKIWRRVALAVLGLTLLLYAIESRGQTVTYEEGLATGIQNLRLNNICYDARFVDGSYLSNFSDADPTFLDQPVIANQAANAIKEILNAERLVPKLDLAPGSEQLWIPNDRVNRNRFRAEQVGHAENTTPWKRYLDFEGMVNHEWDSYDFVVFEEGAKVIYADNTGHAVGIRNLNLDGDCVDVRFARGSYNDVYGKENPRYLGLELRGDYAANQIMEILNNEVSVPEINDSNNEVVWIPTDRTRTTFQAEQVGHDLSYSPWRRFGDFSGATNLHREAWEFTVFGETLDCNGDGHVDVKDMNCSCESGLGPDVLDAIGSIRGDLNGNGAVGFADFLKLSNNFGDTGQYTDGDLNCDGLVTFADFLILSTNYGKGQIDLGGPIVIANAVPEPDAGVVAVLFLPIALLLMRRRRRGI